MRRCGALIVAIFGLLLFFAIGAAAESGNAPANALYDLNAVRAVVALVNELYPLPSNPGSGAAAVAAEFSDPGDMVAAEVDFSRGDDRRRRTGR
jgi:hypothetical protein